MSFENPQNEESLMRERIGVIEKIPTGVQPKAEVVLVLLGERQASEMYIPNKNNAPKAAEDLIRIGLFAQIIEADEKSGSADIAVANSKETLEELLQTKPNKNHRRYGELMGYPSTAIDAYLGENNAERVSNEDQSRLTENLPDVLHHFILSKNNNDEELAVLNRWLKLIAQHSPELFDELYSKEDSDIFKKRLNL
ncbi:hypothetical protein H0W91_04265 [Patescibacteria group bacterium]|nr:hypothetical protein [Patescibacteria group bacterium]